MESEDKFGKYSESYDIFNAGKDYSAEVDFFLERVKFVGGTKTLLELGCGTGQHALKLANRRIKIKAVDLSDQMLERAPEHPLIQYQQGDIKEYSELNTFDYITSFFHVFSYMKSLEDLEQVLRRSFENLKSGGILFFDFWYTPAVMYNVPEARVKVASTGHDKLLKRVTSVTEDVIKKLVHVKFDFYFHDESVIEHFYEIHTMRHFDITEIELLSNSIGFELAETGEMLTNKNLGRDTWNAYVKLVKR